MRLAPLLALVALSGCSLVDGGDPFDDPFFDVYDAELAWIEGVPPVTGRIGLTYIASDAVVLGCESTGGYTGRWELTDLNDRFPEGEGSIRGSRRCDGTVQLFLFDGIIRGDTADEGVLYVIEGDLGRDGQFVGTWDRIGSYPEGAFSARRTREATERVTVP